MPKPLVKDDGLADVVRAAGNPPDAGVLIATKDGFICAECFTPEEHATLGEPEVEVWEEYSHGWTGPCMCSRCKLSIPVYVDGVPCCDRCGRSDRPLECIAGEAYYCEGDPACQRFAEKSVNDGAEGASDDRGIDATLEPR